MSAAPRAAGHAILSPGRNCWAAPRADAAGLLVDARNYYRAFCRAARAARRYLLIAGWRFTSDVRLLRGRDAAGAGDTRLVPFLAGLCRANPDLRVYVLAWDYSVNFLLAWEWFQRQRFEAAHPHIRFLFDGHHAVGACHHQKVVVADGQVAFVGGLDFSRGDWDDRRHRATNPQRVDARRSPHGPYHDVQAYVTGSAAAELAGHFRKRWRAAGGGDLDLPPPPPDPPALDWSGLPLPPGRVALSRTEPKTLDDPADAREVRQLFLDALAAAEELVYLENQYFSSRAVAAALLDRMAAPGRPSLDIVLVLPKQLPSWVEAAAMGPPRIRLLGELRQAARRHGHRLGVYYPAAHDAGREVPITVHSKLLIVDDRFLTVGSANASNRSMGLDTELNLAWEAAAGDHALVRAIRRVRTSLLAEHCGLRRSPARRALTRRRGLVLLLDRLAADLRSRLRPLTDEAVFEDRQWLKALTRWGFAFDPETPVVEETVYEALAPAANGAQARGWLRRLVPGRGRRG